MGFFNKFFGKKKNGLDSVSGAMVASDSDGKVIYNMLTPHMQQFLGRSVGAIKKEGICAKGTGQFSILVGDDQKVEIKLSVYYRENDDPANIQAVVNAAKELLRQ